MRLRLMPPADIDEWIVSGLTPEPSVRFSIITLFQNSSTKPDARKTSSRSRECPELGMRGISSRNSFDTNCHIDKNLAFPLLDIPPIEVT